MHSEGRKGTAQAAHIADYHSKDSEAGTLWRYRCRCGQSGMVWYSDKEHARKAFWIHSSYADGDGGYRVRA